MTIDGSQPNFVRHGWAFGSGGCLDEIIDNAARCAKGLEHARFELWVDGQPVEPTIFNTWEMQALPEWRDCPQDSEVTWPATWIFEFPAGFSTPGNHTLEGVWSLWAHLDCVPCQQPIDIAAEQGWTITDTRMISPVRRESITLTVL